MIISIPALFIVITNFFFPQALPAAEHPHPGAAGAVPLHRGGCAAGLFDQIGLVLVMRALVGVGVGILMPPVHRAAHRLLPAGEAGLPPGDLLGHEPAGGVIATLLAGACWRGISWRASFLVYLLGLGSILLCLRFLPKGGIPGRHPQPRPPTPLPPGGSWTFFVYVLAMFLLMSTFFLYPANFALETSEDGGIGQQYIAAIMAGADLVALFGGLLFVRIQGFAGRHQGLRPLLFLVGATSC